MKKGMSMAFAVLIMILSVSGSHAALVKFVDLPGEVGPNEGVIDPEATPGSFEFSVKLEEMGSLPNVDSFTVGLHISGADGLVMGETMVTGPVEPDYIFWDNSFAFSANNPGDDMTRVVFGDVTANGAGVENAMDKLLGKLTLVYPALDPGTVLTLSLIDGDSFVESDDSTNIQSEDLIGQATIYVTPIPGAIWLMGAGLLALFNIRRRQFRQT